MVKKITKNTLLFGVVGVALALLAPSLMTLAVGLGVPGSFATATLEATSPIWSGIFFGAFGALAMVATPVMDWLFNDAPKPTAAATQPRGLGILKARSPQPQLDLPQQYLAPTTSFQDKIAAERTQSALEQGRH